MESSQLRGVGQGTKMYEVDLSIYVLSFISSSMALMRSTKSPNLALFSERLRRCTIYGIRYQTTLVKTKYQSEM